MERGSRKAVLHQSDSVQNPAGPCTLLWKTEARTPALCHAGDAEKNTDNMRSLTDNKRHDADLKKKKKFPCTFHWLQVTNLDGLIGIGDESDEEAEHHVDEERDEGVEVDSAEQPHHVALVSHLQEGGEHVVSIDQWEETLSHLGEWSELGKRDSD